MWPGKIIPDNRNEDLNCADVRNTRRRGRTTLSVPADDRYRRVVRAIAAIASMAAIALSDMPAYAQRQVGNDIPLLLVIEDSEDNAVERDSPVFRSVLNHISDMLLYQGYVVVDEDQVRRDAGWYEAPRNKRSKHELTIDIEDMLDLKGVKNRFRLWMLFKIHVDKKEQGYRTYMLVRSTAELYDINMRKLYSYSPENSGWFIVKERECVRFSTPCFKREVADQMETQAESIGADLGRTLSSYLIFHGDRCPECADLKDYGPLTTYDVSLQRFEQNEVLAITSVMEDLFPGNGVSIWAAELTSTRSRYWYSTSAKGHKLREWIHILLTDMNWNVNEQIVIDVDGTSIVVKKIVQTPGKLTSPDQIRFPY